VVIRVRPPLERELNLKNIALGEIDQHRVTDRCDRSRPP
jgi:hypothetical protein